MEKNRSPAGDMAKEFLMILKVFAAAIIGFLVLAGFFVPAEISSITYAILILINIALATAIATGTMILLIALGGRFLRLF